MLQPKIKSKVPGKQNKLVAPANDSYMIGLDPKTIATNARIMKEAAKGPRMKMTKDGSTILSPLKQKSVIEKGSYEKGKQEKYASKSAMAKHEKKETKQFEKKEMKKSPLKQVSALSGKKDKSTVAPKTVAAGVAKRSPILMKKKC